MTGPLYRLLEQGGKLLGLWFFELSARVIALGYFLFSPQRAESTRFYRTLFPGRGLFFPLFCTLRQYQHFTTIHSDRLRASQGRGISFHSEGWERLPPYLNGKGAILLMSHLGNWEMAARFLTQQDARVRLLLYMGAKEREGVEAMQKEGLRQHGVRIIALGRDEQNPFAAVEGVRFLQSGGVVSMPGDIVWQPHQRTRKLRFLDHVAYAPEAPFVLAMASEAPIFVFFAFRHRRGEYCFSLSEPIFVRPERRSERDQAIAQAAQRYAELLEAALRRHPWQWRHFKRFIHEPWPPTEG